METGDEFLIIESAVFRSWLDKLRDRDAKIRIGGGVNELRLHFGPGYRVYYKWFGDVLIILLTGGDKATQARDIERAKRMAKEAEDGIEDVSV